MNKFNFRFVNKSCATCKQRFLPQASDRLLTVCPGGWDLPAEGTWISLEHIICDLYEPIELIFDKKS